MERGGLNDLMKNALILYKKIPREPTEYYLNELTVQ